MPPWGTPLRIQVFVYSLGPGTYFGELYTSKHDDDTSWGLVSMCALGPFWNAALRLPWHASMKDSVESGALLQEAPCGGHAQEATSCSAQPSLPQPQWKPQEGAQTTHRIMGNATKYWEVWNSVIAICFSSQHSFSVWEWRKILSTDLIFFFFFFFFFKSDTPANAFSYVIQSVN